MQSAASATASLWRREGVPSLTIHKWEHVIVLHTAVTEIPPPYFYTAVEI